MIQNRPDEIEVNGVAQIFSHWTYVAFAKNYTKVRAVFGVAPESEVLGMEVLASTQTIYRCL